MTAMLGMCECGVRVCVKKWVCLHVCAHRVCYVGEEAGKVYRHGHSKGLLILDLPTCHNQLL